MIRAIDHEHIRELRLDRPPANALSPELVAALEAALVAAPREGAGAVVLSGAPGMFSAGLDVPLLLSFDRVAISALWRGFYSLLRAIASSPVPVAAAITGHAPAGGTVLTLFCDWRVMAEGDWKIGVSEVQVGLPLPPVIFYALRRQLGRRHAERLAASGVLLSPAEALSIGLVDELAPAEHTIERALEWCHRLLALPARAMSETRRLARADLVALFDRDTDPELERVLAEWWNPDAQTVLHALVARLGKKNS